MPPRGRGQPPGVPLRHGLRTIVDAALYHDTTGCIWRDLPDSYPPYRTIERYYNDWVRAGRWTNLCTRLQAHANGDPIPPAPTTARSWRPQPSDVTDTEWDLVADLVAPPGTGRVGNRGRPFKHDLRTVLDAVLYREATGCRWQDLSDRYPPHRSVDRFYNQWRRDGTWDTIRHRLQATIATADAGR